MLWYTKSAGVTICQESVVSAPESVVRAFEFLSRPLPQAFRLTRWEVLLLSTVTEKVTTVSPPAAISSAGENTVSVPLKIPPENCRRRESSSNGASPEFLTRTSTGTPREPMDTESKSNVALRAFTERRFKVAGVVTVKVLPSLATELSRTVVSRLVS